MKENVGHTREFAQREMEKWVKLLLHFLRFFPILSFFLLPSLSLDNAGVHLEDPFGGRGWDWKNSDLQEVYFQHL